MLSPLDLQNKKVVTKKRKYDKLEMDEYLDLVCDNYKELYNQNQELQKQIKTLSDGVQYYRSIESTMQKALVLAEKTSKETKDAAVLKAEAIEKDANAKATKIVSKANQEYEAIKEKCLYLVQQFNQYKMQLKQVATAQLELVTSESFDVYSPELDAIRNAKYSLPETKEQESVSEPVSEELHSELENESATVVESDVVITEKEVDIEVPTNSSVLEKPQNEMDKTVILPDIKPKREKESVSPRTDEDMMSILTKDTIDLREAIPGEAIEAAVKTPEDALVKEAVEAKPIEPKPVEPVEAAPVPPKDALLQEFEPIEQESLEPVMAEEKDAPTLDSLLQNMNLGKKKKKKGQEEDPFEFLGSVDDF